MLALDWQKSSYSDRAANCVNVAISSGRTPRIHLRESDAPEAIVTTTPAHLASLLQKIKAGELDQP
ncbi:DUF397 domain-containing protein [Streptomyces silvisoli]|uniref:DUF397 domain-containing protein n=1 Tax=Streptomyces silvisoli TaxID=3034235 RepID=A0ABT5ZSE3_9ACTN|nr:DUF397 domain-containing protein [Streptomyces silvisoli]MDF3292742.1 DUF397 domain-containing protein [Streptomyces silvisoli]